MKKYKDSAKHGCRACANILKYFGTGHEKAALVFRPRKEPFEYRPCTLFSAEPLTDRREMSLPKWPGWIHTRPKIHFTPDGSSHFTPSGNYKSLHEFFIMEDPSIRTGHNSFTTSSRYDDHPVIVKLKKPSGDTSSEQAFESIRRWLSLCEADHKICNSWTGGSLPCRVLEIQSINPLHVRVVENCRESKRYACLSYRWGPETQSKSLNRGNLDEYKAGIPEAQIYPLVKDAITAAHRLGLRYLWIDSYCILQGYDGDWHIQAANMASIYENAYFTICATFPEDGGNMFTTSTPKSLGTHITEIGGKPVFVREQLMSPSGPTLGRAWVFQERLLSNRVIYFTEHEIAWECRERMWCECESCGDEASSWLGGGRPGVPKVLPKLEWKAIVKEYDNSELTYKEDKLPALAGVARRHGESSGKTYLAGLWKEDMPTALMWVRPDGGVRPLDQQCKVAPTWSWASLPSGNCRFRDFDANSVRLLGYSRSSPEADIYTATGKTEITIEGPVLDVRVYKQGQLQLRNDTPRSRLIGTTENAFFIINADFDMEPEDPTEYQAVSDGTTCSLLLFFNEGKRSIGLCFGILLLQKPAKNGEKPTFERIGHLDYENISSYSHLDKSGKYANYCGGTRSWPFLEESHSPVTLAWLLERAEKRQIALV